MITKLSSNQLDFFEIVSNLFAEQKTKKIKNNNHTREKLAVIVLLCQKAFLHIS